jgi:glucosylglycerate hydrolase
MVTQAVTQAERRVRTRSWRKVSEEPAELEELVAEAGQILRRNDMGGWTRAAPELYPHQWSWDSAFIAIGLAHLDTRRAAQELRTLFAHQWMTGKVPHIVFNPKAPPKSYYPGAEHWACAASSPDAPPAPPYTSCLCQPPVHAIAALRIWKAAPREGEKALAEATDFLREIYPRLFAWHRYLATFRDPERSGLVTIYHPWASGTDNSPRWDGALAAIEVGEMETYPRFDLQHLDDPSERPASAEYDRYLWLVKLIKRAGCDERVIYRSHPFLVKDVLFSAILVAANEALLEIAEVVEAPDEERDLLESWAGRGRQGLKECWDEKLNLCLDYDLRADRPLRARTVAGIAAPLIAGRQNPQQLEALLGELDSSAFAGHPELRWPLPPSTSPKERGFHPRSYWRGPVWPVANWLLWWSLIRAGEPESAARIRRASLDQIAEGGFAEYFEPFTGEPLGSNSQSWTAAVVLDWLQSDSLRKADSRSLQSE